MTATEYFNALIEKNEVVKPGKMFGCLCMKTPNGKAAAMLWHDYLVVKLNGADLEAGLAIKQAQMFEPMKGRTMNGWVQIPYAQKKHWAPYLEKSIKLVKALPSNKSK